MPQPQEDETDDLQFEVAELGGPDGLAVAPSPLRLCVGCRRPIDGTYYAVGDRLVCPTCREQADAPPPGRRAGRLAKASLFGAGAGLVGAAIWFAVRRVAHVEIGLIAVLVGYMVGKAVRKGSGGRGGRGYQVLAVVLTYSCISATYVPDVVEAVIGYAHKHPAAANVDGPGAKPKPTLGKALVAVGVLAAVVAGIALAAPFAGGAQNLFGLLIIGFALWEAWKFNARRRIPFTGPYFAGGPAITPGTTR